MSVGSRGCQHVPYACGKGRWASRDHELGEVLVKRFRNRGTTTGKPAMIRSREQQMVLQPAVSFTARTCTANAFTLAKSP